MTFTYYLRNLLKELPHEYSVAFSITSPVIGKRYSG